MIAAATVAVVQFNDKDVAEGAAAAAATIIQGVGIPFVARQRPQAKKDEDAAAKRRTACRNVRGLHGEDLDDDITEFDNVTKFLWIK